VDWKACAECDRILPRQAFQSKQSRCKECRALRDHGRLRPGNLATQLRKRAARSEREQAARVPGYVITDELLRQKLRHWGRRCHECSRPLESVHVSWDHVKPLHKQGLHLLSNLRPMCPSCNSRKGAKWPYPIRYSARLTGPLPH